jgi:hypothetical protein
LIVDWFPFRQIRRTNQSAALSMPPPNVFNDVEVKDRNSKDCSCQLLESKLVVSIPKDAPPLKIEIL